MARFVSVVIFGLLVTACTSETAPTTTAVAPVEGPGRLAIIDGDGSVVVIDGDGSNRTELAATGEAGLGFAQPIWSADGSYVSWAQTGPEGFAYVVQDPDDGEPTEVALAQFPFYAFWSPTGERVGVLRNGERGVVFELVDVSEGESTIVDTDTPFYFSWSPTGDGVVAHAGATRLVSRDASGVEESQSQTGDGYLAPQWLDQGILHVDGDELVADGVDGGRSSIAEVSGFTTFVANRQGSLVAIQTVGPDDAVTVSVALATAPSIISNALVVVETATGEVSTVSDTPVIAFFWSPDGVSLLMLSLSETRDSIETSVWSETGVDEYSTYVPAGGQVRDVFPFFPQYAQSHSFWSADSQSFAFVGDIGDESGVWVQDVDEAEPELVSAGSWAAWSP